MKSTSLTVLAAEQLAAARRARGGRAATTVHGGRGNVLRQTVLTLLAGQELAEHDGPAEATLQIVSGEVRLTAGTDSWHGATGDHLTIPPRRHSLYAIDDSVLLLTVVVTAAAAVVVVGDPDPHPDGSVSVDLARLRRWEDSGGTWRIIHRQPASLAVALDRCDGGEEADRYTTHEPDVLAHVRGRQSSEEDQP